VLVPDHGRRAMVPLGQLAKVGFARARRRSAPRTRCSAPTSTSTSAAATSAATSPTRSKAVAEQVKFPPGYYVTWSGQFEYMERAIDEDEVVVPLTLLIIFLLLYLNFRRSPKR
jgi:Cu(I)/Ag(I) efflux system membrane protein CusA/SilA